MNYDKEIEEEAYDFIFDHEESMVQALKDDSDWDYNGIDDLDRDWHECIVDRGYSLEDAAYIISECHEEETDRGLWEGLDASDALSAQAAYSYANDVWFKCEELYNELKEMMQELIDEKDEDDERDDDEFAQIAFDKFYEERRKPEITPVKKDSDEELNLICRWLRVNKEDAGMRGGYPVGGSYIDARCGTGHGMPEVKEYVEFDHVFAKKVPWLSGKYKEAVQDRHDELVERRRTTKVMDYALLNGMDNKHLRDNLPMYILYDKRLSLAEIREIIRRLQNGVY